MGLTKLVAKQAWEKASQNFSPGQIPKKTHKYLFGYRVSDLGIFQTLPAIPPVKESMFVSEAWERDPDPLNRKPMAVSLGCHLKDTAPIKADLADTEGARASAYYRLGRGMYKMTRRVCRSLKRFALSWVRKHFKPIDPSTVDVSVEDWIAKSNYTETQKAYYLGVWQDMQENGFTLEKVLKNKGFLKEEPYKEPKYPRNIYGPSDYTKVLLGPIFKLIEELVFTHPAFIKHVAIAKRAKYIHRRLSANGGMYYWTDHTCFEAGVSAAMMKAVEFPIYKYLAGNLPGFEEWFRLVCRDSGMNYIVFKNFWMEISATRLSGRMNTSLGNGLVNLITQKWVAKMSGAKVKCCIEGDDCIARILHGDIDLSWYKQLGMIVKFEKVVDLGGASFVGMVFGSDGTMVRDPMKFLVQLGWSTRQYAGASSETLMCLARSKALSAIVETPQAPIVTAAAKYVERTTRVVHPKMQAVMNRNGMSLWDRERWLEVSKVFESEIRKKSDAKPTEEARFAVAEQFGVPIELQESIEEYFNNNNTYGEIDPPNVDLADPSYYERVRKHYDMYVKDEKDYGCYIADGVVESYVAEMSFRTSRV